MAIVCPFFPRGVPDSPCSRGRRRVFEPKDQGAARRGATYERRLNTQDDDREALMHLILHYPTPAMTRVAVRLRERGGCSVLSI